jgi:ribosomal protein L11 methyltransferase
MLSSDPRPNYFVVELKDIPRESAEAVTALGFELGAEGSSEDLSFEQAPLTYEAVPVEAASTTMKFYFESPPSPEGMEALRGHCGSLTLLEETSRDWMEEWKKHFEPVPLSGPYWVVPSWRDVPPSCERPIFIDPGMAFGTGTHETTQLAADFVRAALAMKPKASFLDVGSGTGILSIIAAGEGAGTITANDIDPEARRVARENLARNGLDPLGVTDLDASEIPGRFDVVAANILDHVLLRLSETLLSLKKEDGLLVLSGILLEREESFAKDFIGKSGLRILARASRGEWAAFLLS